MQLDLTLVGIILLHWVPIETDRIEVTIKVMAYISIRRLSTLLNVVDITIVLHVRVLHTYSTSTQEYST